MGLALLAGPVLPYQTATVLNSSGAAVTDARVHQTAHSIEVVLTGAIIPTSSYLEVKAYDIAHWDTFDMDVVASTGNGQSGNATANVSWRITDQTSDYELSTATHTEGTPVTAFDSNILRWRLNSNVAAPSTVTGNLLITWE